MCIRLSKRVLILPVSIKKAIKVIYNCLRIRLDRLYNKLKCKQYLLIKKPESLFPIVAQISDETWNTMYTPEIFEICKERQIIAKYPSLFFYKMNNATIKLGSDIFLTDKGAWWDKYNEDDFMTLCIPADDNVISYNHNVVDIIPAKKKRYIKGNVISITGVWSYAWSHWIFEFVSRLFFAGEVGLLNNDITLITDKYNDENIEYILDNYLKKYPKVKRFIADSQTDYTCENLFAIRCTGTNYNEAKVFWDYRLVIPELVIQKIHQYIVKPIVEKIKGKPVKYKKIYLSRHSNRKLVNTDEVEEFFRKQGFYFIEGCEFSFEEKVDLFYHAEEIVGLHSSAWQNIIFCHNVKCLMMVNHRYAPEMLFYTMAKNNVSSWLNVTGTDVDDSRRSDFYIPLDKIQRAYNKLLNS